MANNTLTCPNNRASTSCLIDGQAIELHVWLIDNVLLDLALIEAKNALMVYQTTLNGLQYLEFHYQIDVVQFMAIYETFEQQCAKTDVI